MDLFKWYKDDLKVLYNHMLYTFRGIGVKKPVYKSLLTSYLKSNYDYMTKPVVNACGYLETPANCSTPIQPTNNVVYLISQVTNAAVFYDNDLDAYNNGVGYLRDYYLSLENTYGSPYGTLKKQVEYQ